MVEIYGQGFLLRPDEEELVRRFYGPNLRKAVAAYGKILDREKRREAPGRNDFKGLMLKVVVDAALR